MKEYEKYFWSINVVKIITVWGETYTCTDRKICTVSHRNATLFMTLKIFMALYTESKMITYSLSRVHRRTYSSYLHQVSIDKLLIFFQLEDGVK